MKTIGLKTELMTRLREVGYELDAARDPREMRRLISERKTIVAALETFAPPALRIVNPA